MIIQNIPARKIANPTDTSMDIDSAMILVMIVLAALKHHLVRLLLSVFPTNPLHDLKFK